MIPALLALADGTIFGGQSIGAPGETVGEVVFNTAMTGYQEILSDPSYAEQIVTLTYPQIGNTGVTPEDMESDQVWAKGLIIRQLPRRASSWRLKQTLPDFLEQAGVVAIGDLDTRRLTRHIRTHGAQAGCIVTGEEACSDPDAAVAKARNFPGLAGMDLAQVVTGEPRNWSESAWTLESGYGERQQNRFRVVAYDFGVKRNILRLLAERGCELTVVPAQTSAEEVMRHNPDGVFLSNGPGDPDPCDYAIRAVSTLLDENVPLFGICLGYQILSLASGAQTMKMPFGHHGANHPVQDLASREVIITSQNHGFAVDEGTLPNCLEVTHKSLFDGTLQGLRRTDRPAFGFQGHPEASPGPQDCQYLFDQFIDLMEARRGA